jgi:hypothetical protein
MQKPAKLGKRPRYWDERFSRFGNRQITQDETNCRAVKVLGKEVEARGISGMARQRLLEYDG